VDVINKLTELYKSQSTSVEDKIVIAETMDKIYKGSDEFGF
jgi:hypothetical protein